MNKMKINRLDRIIRPGDVRVCIIGHLLGRNPGFVTTQGLITADLFSKSGYDVISVSSKVNRVSRLSDMILTIIRNRKEIDVLIVEAYSGLSFLMTDAVSLVSSILKIPAVAVLHGGSLPEFVVQFPRWTSRVFRRFSEIVSPSDFLRKVVKGIGFDSRIIPNVIDLDKYPYTLRSHVKPRLLWMRGFHDIYNPRMAVATLDLIRREYPEATMVMAGADKGLEAGVKRLVLDLGLTTNVRFPGFLDEAATFI
jgi:glycosyltransferase involved in cell wall biosynthesis